MPPRARASKQLWMTIESSEGRTSYLARRMCSFTFHEILTVPLTAQGVNMDFVYRREA